MKGKAPVDGNILISFQFALRRRKIRLIQPTITYNMRVCLLERTALRSHSPQFNAVNHSVFNKNKQSFGMSSKANIGVLSNRVLTCFK